MINKRCKVCGKYTNVNSNNVDKLYKKKKPFGEYYTNDMIYCRNCGEIILLKTQDLSTKK